MLHKNVFCREACVASFASYLHVFQSMRRLHGPALIDMSQPQYSPPHYLDEAACRMFGTTNMFEWYFRQECVNEVVDAQRFVSGYPPDPGEPGYYRYNFWSAEDLEFKRKNMVPWEALPHVKRMAVEALGRACVSKGSFIGSDWEHDYIVFSYRAGDKHREAPLPSFGCVKKALEYARCGQLQVPVFYHTESDEFADMMKQIYNSFRIDLNFGWTVNKFLADSNTDKLIDSILPQPGYLRGLRVAVLLEIFRRAPVLVKNHGNLSDLGAAFGSGQVIHVTPDLVKGHELS